MPISSKLAMLMGLIIALSNIGIELGPILAGVGIMGFIVGFARQDTLSNFASGVMILIYRPFDVTDYIEAAGVGRCAQNEPGCNNGLHGGVIN